MINLTFTTEQLKEIISSCNEWNGALEEYRWYEFDEDFFNTFFFNNPMEAARACFFGEINSWYDDHIRFDNCDNLESCNTWQYEELLQDNAEEIINTALEERKNGVDFSTEINALLDQLEK